VPLGFALFSIAMALGRLVGDRSVARHGARLVVVFGSFSAAVGLSIGLLVATPLAFLIGVTIAGGGLSGLFPIAAGQAARTGAADRSRAVAGITAFGYTGFLLGPPLIGLTSSLAGLQLALGGLVVLLFVAMVNARLGIVDAESTRELQRPT